MIPTTSECTLRIKLHEEGGAFTVVHPVLEQLEVWETLHRIAGTGFTEVVRVEMKPSELDDSDLRKRFKPGPKPYP